MNGTRSTAEILDRHILQATKSAIGLRTEADFARWLGVSAQRLNGWLNGKYRVSDLWIIQTLRDPKAAPALKDLAGRLMEIHARKARSN
jgi:hypothetical protein